MILPVCPEICFLAAGGCDNKPLRAGGLLRPLALLACELGRPDGTDARVTLRVVATRLYFCSSPPEPSEQESEISADREIAGGWETFAAESLPDEKLPAGLAGILVELENGAALADPTRVVAGAQSARAQGHAAEDIDVAACLIDVLPPETLRRLRPALASLASYEVLFAHLQPRLAGDETVFAFNTERAMKGQAEMFGWQIGAHSYGAPEIIDAQYGYLSIGKFCSIAGQVQIIVANHATDRVTTYPFNALQKYWPGATESGDDHIAGDVVIGHCVWIGVGACIVPGARIGHGSIIGARAVARGTIPPFSVVVGNPGRVIRRLFDDAIIERLLAVAWWDWPDGKVDRFIPLLLGTDIEAFLRAAEAEVATVANDSRIAL